jgi:choline dehydrogenase-like flavoprotein
MKALVGPAIVPSPKEDAPDAEWEVFVKDICQYLFPLANISYLELYTLSPLHLCISHVHDGDRLDPSTDAKKKTSVTSNSHPLGTAAMMARELGGVVDSSLKVYGTANVRVVDASVLPMQISGHLTSTLYAVAERAADMIKGNL